MSSLVGRLNTGNLNGLLNRNQIAARAFIPAQNDYDDTELRELIAETLVDAEAYTDTAIENYEEQDPTMESITNQEINHIFSQYFYD